MRPHADTDGTASGDSEPAAGETTFEPQKETVDTGKPDGVAESVPGPSVEERTARNRRLVEILGSYGSWLVPLIVYLSTIAPCVTAGDAGEFIVATHRFSLVHPPGYPLYMLLLKLWSALPFSLGPDPLAVKCNLFSAIAMALMCGIFYRVLRTLTGSASASLAPTLTLAFSRTLWKFAVVTEVYALHLLLMVIMLAGLVIAREGRKPFGLVISALGIGFGLAHHHTILLMLPMVAFLCPWRMLRKPGLILGVIAAIILPLVLYLFLPVFAKNTPGYAEKGFTAGDLIDTITRAEYRERTAYQDYPPEELVGPKDILDRALRYLPKQVGWIVLVLCVAGWFFAPAGKRVWAFWSGATAVIWILAVSFLSRGSPLGMPFNFLRSVDEFLLPVNIFLALGLGWLLAPPSDALESTRDLGSSEGQNFIAPQLIPIAIMLLFCVIPFFVGRGNLQYSNMSHHTYFQDQSRNILNQVPQGGVAVVSGDESFMFEYLEEVRGIRPDVEMVVYPFSYVSDGRTYSPIESLTMYLQTALGDRGCVFTFGDSAQAVEMLQPPRALRLDGVTLVMTDRIEGMPIVTKGDPNIWTTYQLRNFDGQTLSGLVFDDFEYETINRYTSGLKAAVSWLDENGYGNDVSRAELNDFSIVLEILLRKVDYPLAPKPAEETGG